MRTFFSYGPVDCEQHFCVPRHELIERCLHSLIGDPAKGGHYFTIWAPRQSGKTWLMRQVKQQITQHDSEQFAIYHFSLGNLRGMNWEPEGSSDEPPMPRGLSNILREELPGHPDIEDWEQFREFFLKEAGNWDRPLLLFIDEFDTAPPALIDLLVGAFREMYLNRESHWLHGLALIGVRAVLGVDSYRGSPFNVQRSLHVPNLTRAEVVELYRQYQDESGQKIEKAVVDEVFRTTQGQPGLVSWFGELLTETYNPGHAQTIEKTTWETVLRKAMFVEPNNGIMNLIAKARDPEYQPFLLELFTHADIPFSFHKPLHNYLYMHGILDLQPVSTPKGDVDMCRFTSPFVQHCLYEALGDELVGDHRRILVLDPLDELTDVFEGTALNLPALLRRYKDYLSRLKAKGMNPWKDQPRRKTDFQLTEAVGHFHLYAWLRDAIGHRCIVSPEFPTGNGKVDIHLKCDHQRGLIEIKSFVGAYQLKTGRGQAAGYAKSLGMDAVTLVVFLPVDDESVLEQLSGEEMRDGVRVTVVAIGWV